MASIAELIESQGVVRPVDGNNVLPLDDSESIWVVRSGSVDVFAVPRDEQGQAGARIHLCRAQPGQILCGCPSESNDQPHLIAVGLPGSEIAELQQSRIRESSSDEQASEEFGHLLETWIDQLTAGVSQRRLPHDALLLEPGTNGQFDAGKAVSPPLGVCWIAAGGTAHRFLGRVGLPGGPADGVFPLAASGWVVVDGKTQFSAATTASLRGGSRLWDGLQQFHKVILTSACENARQANAADLQRLEEKSQAEQRMTESALSQLAATVSQDTVAVETYGDDPLLTACQIVGAQRGMAVRAPANYREQKFSDPLDAIARASAVRVRRVVLADQWWRGDNGPLLGYLNDGDRPVALVPVSPSRYEIVDQQAGTRTPVTAAAASRLRAFGYTFYRSFPPRALKARDVFRFGLLGTGRDWGILIALGIATGLLGLLIPVATGWVIGEVIPGAQRSQLLLVMLVLLITMAVGVLLSFVQGIAMLRIETRMDSAVESAVWDRLLNLPASFFRSYTSGDLSMRAMGISHIRQAISQTVSTSVLTFLSSFVYFILLFYYASGLALLATLLFFIIVAATGVAVYYQLPHERAQQHHRGRVWGIVLQLFTGISRLRVAGAENRALAYWARNYSQQTRSSIRSQMVSNNLESFMASLPVVAPLAIFASVSLFPLGNLSIAMFLAFNVAFLQIITAGMTMSGTISSVLDIVPLYERAKPILKTRPEYDRDKRDPGELTGEIEISNASFRYHADAPLVLEGVSLNVRPGEFVAFVGPSGAGKSTILRLLLGFEAPVTGSIYYDREDLAGLDQLSVRRQIGVVLQDGKLTPGDILNNIIGNAPLTHEDAWEAARLSGLDEDIKQMPMGMFTLISDGESTLSGGQRQRLLIARAIVKRPKFLFFDEATSALDNVTQAKVSQSLENLKATRIVIAHRLSTVINADRIYVLEAGKIVQQGSYQELKDQPGLFAHLVKRQLL